VPQSNHQTISERIKNSFHLLTPTEKQLANSILENFPSSCLGSITVVASVAGVSPPTVVRMARKLGFSGFPDFQANLHNEIEERINNPLEKFTRWSKKSSDTHILNLFADAAVKNLNNSLEQIDFRQFDQIAKILSDERYGLFLVGGRITSSLAGYMFSHIKMIRKHVNYLDPNPSVWSAYLLDMAEGDVLVVFDVRRYEQNMITFCKIAKARGIRVVLFTDQWGSPAAKYAIHSFNLRIEAPSAWDSSIVTLFIIESLISAMQKENMESTQSRIEELENLFDKTKLFKKNPNIK